MHVQYQSLKQGDDTHPLRSILTSWKTQDLFYTPAEATHLDLQHLLSKNRQSLPTPVTALTLSNVLTTQECSAMIERTEALGYDIALINVGSHQGGVHMPGYRDGKRCIVDDVQFTKELWERVKSHIPAVWEGREVVGMNERLRFLKYLPGDQFAPHMDGEYRRTDGSGEVTKITIQFYLNGSEDDALSNYQGHGVPLKGGETTFLSEKYYGKHDVKANDKDRVPVTCKTGQVLIFQHDLVHEGSPVEQGCKYVVRGDILYGPRKNAMTSFAST
ncbi:hypothetical protein FBU30_008884 [Linnemannia zychae]|nr:hypothetical protein FBU30_008884 [Linnemannia zychae]